VYVCVQGGARQRDEANVRIQYQKQYENELFVMYISERGGGLCGRTRHQSRA